MTEYVSLVDEQDNEIGVMEKLQAHQEALLHRAISVFIFNDRKELLLQQRAAEKYHSPLLWTNTCCSHPRPGEVVIEAANRRLMEEMRMACNLTYEFSFTYKAVLTEELTEHEFDHVFFGESNETPVPNPAEVADWKYMALDDIEADMEENPGVYTSWFKLMLDKIKSVRNDHTD
ncbi:isopentenyl-diphosphate Delta-isomerase [Pedobacter sp. MC2016-15]|uniref:isopentenyl-diphosphate Delta-isomerase n=1 Tax=Pedobacter sp. MC2016-15 TaxID=2994473 RepID=UPI002245BBF7|nr:isopentenyl-diphosphate Delta-isomerase [Pedobacter sp. MC2016-15]MCX2480663.1 isopentenyl-diphosphate Delta-isomerase [Pedobacter sp. MC2016-15]